MRRPNREFTVFSISAIDLFASALGAFILLVMLLFPYYRNAGERNTHAPRAADILQQRQETAGELINLLATRDDSARELEQLEAANRSIEEQLTRQRSLARDLEKKLAAEPVAERVEEPVPVDDSFVPTADQEFSILGIATAAKSFVLVIDMSGSMMAYSDLMLSSVLEMLEPLDESNQVAILGYQGEPSPVLWNYPDRNTLMPATPENLRQAREFTLGLTRRFAGSTPTHAALTAALEYQSDAIILLSDGAPDTNPNYIIQEITNRNRAKHKEIHTVAIGDYTQNRTLVMFMQMLAEQNNGDFVGVSR